MRIKRLPYILLFLLPLLIEGQQAKLEYYNTASGLPIIGAGTIVQDIQGFIWFSSGGKLLRYDGENFIDFQPPIELQEQIAPIGAILTHQDSLLLFQTNTSVPYCLNTETGNWKAMQLDIQGQDATIWHQQARDRNDPYLHLSDGENWRAVQLRDNHLQSIKYPAYLNPLASLCNYVIDSNNYTYLATPDTLYYLSPQGAIVSQIPVNSIEKNIKAFLTTLDANDNLIFVVGTQFWIWNRLDNIIYPHAINRHLKETGITLRDFAIEENGDIWLVGDNRYLANYQVQKDTLFHYREQLKEIMLDDYDFISILRDNTGVIWAGTKLGLLKVIPQKYPFETYYTHQQSDGSFYSFRNITEDKQGKIYAFAYGHHPIVTLNPYEKKETQAIPEAFPNLLTSLYTQEDKLWLHPKGYIELSSYKANTTAVPYNLVDGHDTGFFSKDRRNQLWYLDHNALYYLDLLENNDQWVKDLQLYSGPETFKTSALYASLYSDHIWVSFENKLLQYHPESQKQVWFNPKDWGLPHLRILAIEEDNQGVLWLGTDKGLAYVEPQNKKAQLFTIQDGLPNDFICGLLPEGDSCLWLSTNRGLSRFSKTTSNFINFFEEDGIAFNEFNRRSFFRNKDGQLFFGGIRGMTAFYPAEIMKAYKSKDGLAELVLTSFEYTDERTDTLLIQRSFNQQPEIHLRHWDWSYGFEYALMDYRKSSEIYYSFQMEGYKNKWSAPSKDNKARFNGLPSGNYTFRVKARNDRGKWHPNQLAVKVVVYPPWWETWWAYTAYILILAWLIYSLYQFQINRHKEKTETARIKELDQLKSRLYTNITHEFRTPLTVILGMAEQIKQNPTLHLQNGVGMIERNSKNLLQLVNQLLDLSKMESHSLQLDWQQSDVVSFLRYISLSFSSFANMQNLSIQFFTNINELIMDFDAERLKQVMSNLMSNAIKFTDSGGSIKVFLERQDHQLAIKVKDTGTGIAAEQLPHIFNRFYQADSSSTRKGEGTGIGLAHTREVVKLMGGQISVESEIGKGSVFTILLPSHHQAELVNMSSPMKQNVPFTSILSNAEDNPSPQNNGQKDLPELLIIEDNPDVVAYLKTCLADHYHLHIAYNGRIGIEKALEKIPDLIISDIMMPEKDGFEVCDTLKNDEKTSHIPIILLTAKADVASKIDGLKRGADAYLAKPFHQKELLVRLEMLMEQQQRLKAYFSKNVSTPLVEKTDSFAPVVLHEDKSMTPPLPETAAIEIEHIFIQKVRKIVEENYANEDFALPQLCQKIGMSRSQLYRKMKALIDVSPSKFIRSYRLAKAKTILEGGDWTVSEVTWKVGFKDVAHFSKAFLGEFGVLPSEV